MTNRRITKPATLRGVTNRRAWALDLDAIRKHRKIPPDVDASVGSWLVEAPGLTPYHNSYLFMLIHLRPTPRGNAMKVQPEMTHELAMFGLHIDADLDLFSRTFGSQAACGGKSPLIVPPMYAGQCIMLDDEAFSTLVSNCMRMLVANSVDPTAYSLSKYWSSHNGWISYMGIKSEEAVH